MKIYKSADLKDEIKTLDLGVVDAGQTKSFTYYILNDSKALVDNISIEVTHKEVTTISFPKTLKENEVGQLVLEWKPSITLKEGLKTYLHIEASELWS